MQPLPRRSTVTSAVATALTLCTVAVGTTVMGTAPASAAVVPTLAITTSGDSDWALTYDPGSQARNTAECTVTVGGKQVSGDGRQRAVTLRGSHVRPGRHPAQVRCGQATSPVLWIYAPRTPLTDIATWASNTTAGLLL